MSEENQPTQTPTAEVDLENVDITELQEQPSQAPNPEQEAGGQPGQQGDPNAEHTQQPEAGAQPHQGQQQDPAVQEAQGAQQQEEISIDALDTHEKLEELYRTDKTAFYKLPKALVNEFHNSRGLYKRYKETEARAQHRDTQEKIKLKGAEDRIAQALSVLNDPQTTIEQLQAILGGVAAADPNRPATIADIQQMQQQQQEQQQQQQQQQQQISQEQADRANEVDLYLEQSLGGKDAAQRFLTAAHQNMDAYDRQKMQDMLQSGNPSQVVTFLQRFVGTTNTPTPGNTNPGKPGNKHRPSGQLGSSGGKQQLSLNDLNDDQLIQYVSNLTEKQFGKIMDNPKNKAVADRIMTLISS